MGYSKGIDMNQEPIYLDGVQHLNPSAVKNHQEVYIKGIKVIRTSKYYFQVILTDSYEAITGNKELDNRRTGKAVIYRENKPHRYAYTVSIQELKEILNTIIKMQAMEETA